MSEQPEISILDQLTQAIVENGFDKFALRIDMNTDNPTEIMLSEGSIGSSPRNRATVEKELSAALENIDGKVQIDLVRKAPSFSQFSEGNPNRDVMLATFDIESDENSPDLVATLQEAGL